MLGITPDAKEQLESALPEAFFISQNGIISITFIYGRILATLRGKNTNPNVIISIISENNIRTSMSLSRRISSSPMPETGIKWYKANNGDNDEEGA